MECLAIDISPSKLARAIIQVLTLKKLACKSKLSKDILDAAIRILLSEDDRTIFPLYFDSETATRITKAISNKKHLQNHKSQVKRSSDITEDRKKANLIKGVEKRDLSNVNSKDEVSVKRSNLKLHDCRANVKEFSEVERKQLRDESKKPVVLLHRIVTSHEFASKKRSPFLSNRKLQAHKTTFHNKQPQNHIASVKKSNSNTADGQNTGLPKTAEKKHNPNAPVNNSNADDCNRVSVRKPNSKLLLCNGIANGELLKTEQGHFKSGCKRNSETTFLNKQPQNHIASVKKSNSNTADGQNTDLSKTAEKKHNPNVPVNNSNVVDDNRVSVRKPNSKLLLCNGITNSELPKTEHEHFKSGSKRNHDAVCLPKPMLPHESPPKKRTLLPLPTNTNHLFHKTIYNEEYLHNHIAAVEESNIVRTDRQSADSPKSCKKVLDSNSRVWNIQTIDGISVKSPNPKSLVRSVDINRGISAISHNPKTCVYSENKNDVLLNTDCKQLRSTIEEKPIAGFLLSRTMHSHKSAHKKRALLPLPVNSKPVPYRNSNLPLPTPRKVLLPLPTDVLKHTETNGINTKKNKYETYYYQYSH